MKHNDRRFDVEKSEHIDAERTKQNVYWDMYQGYYSDDIMPKNGEMPASFSGVERKFYHERYSDFCEKQNARNERTRHTERNRSPDDLLKDKRTCPEESIMQIGKLLHKACQAFRNTAFRITVSAEDFLCLRTVEVFSPAKVGEQCLISKSSDITYKTSSFSFCVVR